MPILSVAERATRTAYIVDSVPEFVKRTWSMPKRLQMRSAASVEVGEGVTNNIPRLSELSISSTTIGLRWPASIAPKPIERSSNLRPSTSVIYAPSALSIEIGYGSQCWKLDVTPRGSDENARLLSTSDAFVFFVKSSHSAARTAATFSGEIGVDEVGTRRYVFACGAVVICNAVLQKPLT